MYITDTQSTCCIYIYTLCTETQSAIIPTLPTEPATVTTESLTTAPLTTQHTTTASTTATTTANTTTTATTVQTTTKPYTEATTVPTTEQTVPPVQSSKPTTHTVPPTTLTNNASLNTSTSGEAAESATDSSTETLTTEGGDNLNEEGHPSFFSPSGTQAVSDSTKPTSSGQGPATNNIPEEQPPTVDNQQEILEKTIAQLNGTTFLCPPLLVLCCLYMAWLALFRYILNWVAIHIVWRLLFTHVHPQFWVAMYTNYKCRSPYSIPCQLLIGVACTHCTFSLHNALFPQICWCSFMD